MSFLPLYQKTFIILVSLLGPLILWFVTGKMYQTLQIKARSQDHIKVSNDQNVFNDLKDGFSSTV